MSPKKSTNLYVDSPAAIALGRLRQLSLGKKSRLIKTILAEITVVENLLKLFDGGKIPGKIKLGYRGSQLNDWTRKFLKGEILEIELELTSEEEFDYFIEVERLINSFMETEDFFPFLNTEGYQKSTGQSLDSKVIKHYLQSFHYAIKRSLADYIQKFPQSKSVSQHNDNASKCEANLTILQTLLSTLADSETDIQTLQSFISSMKKKLSELNNVFTGNSPEHYLKILGADSIVPEISWVPYKEIFEREMKEAEISLAKLEKKIGLQQGTRDMIDSESQDSQVDLPALSPRRPRSRRVSFTTPGLQIPCTHEDINHHLGQLKLALSLAQRTFENLNDDMTRVEPSYRALRLKSVETEKTMEGITTKKLTMSQAINQKLDAIFQSSYPGTQYPQLGLDFSNMTEVFNFIADKIPKAKGLPPEKALSEINQLLVKLNAEYKSLDATYNLLADEYREVVEQRLAKECTLEQLREQMRTNDASLRSSEIRIEWMQYLDEQYALLKAMEGTLDKKHGLLQGQVTLLQLIEINRLMEETRLACETLSESGIEKFQHLQNRLEDGGLEFKIDETLMPAIGHTQHHLEQLSEALLLSLEENFRAVINDTQSGYQNLTQNLVSIRQEKCLDALDNREEIKQLIARLKGNYQHGQILNQKIEALKPAHQLFMQSKLNPNYEQLLKLREKLTSRQAEIINVIYDRLEQDLKKVDVTKTQTATEKKLMEIAGCVYEELYPDEMNSSVLLDQGAKEAFSKAYWNIQNTMCSYNREKSARHDSLKENLSELEAYPKDRKARYKFKDRFFGKDIRDRERFCENLKKDVESYILTGDPKTVLSHIYGGRAAFPGDYLQSLLGRMAIKIVINSVKQQAAETINPQFDTVERRLRMLELYGWRLNEEDQVRGKIINDLVGHLRQELKKSNWLTQEDYLEFTNCFMCVLHSQDHKLNKLDKKWPVIALNLVLGLISLGIAPMAKLAHSKLTTGRCQLFFQDSAAMYHVHQIEGALKNTIS